MIRLDADWEAQMEEMNRSKRGRPFAYPDLPMGGIAYLRYMIGRDVRITQEAADNILGRGVKGPDHATIWRRICAQSVSIEGDRITIKMTDGKTHVLVADSTGITTTGKGRRTGLRRNVKCSFVKLHILADEESQKILAFRITKTDGGDAKNLPGMPDQTLDRLGIPLEDRGMDPAVSVEVDGTTANENARDHNRVCVRLQLLPADGSRAARRQGEEAPGGHTARRRRVRLPGGLLALQEARRAHHDTREPSMPAVWPTAGTGPGPRPSWNSAYGGCTAARLARMGKDERKKHQE